MAENIKKIKLYLANNSRQQIGGGFTFLSNFRKGAEGKLEFVNDWKDCDIFLIMSCTAVDRGMVASASQAGKKIVLRVDNIPKKSRNKKNPADSLKMFGQLADEVVYQSKWAQQYAGWLIRREGVVIYNGVDYDVFFEQKLNKENRFLFVQYNQDENKRFPEAAYDFHMRFRSNPDIELWLIGLFPQGVLEHDFDLFAGEQYRYFAPIQEREKLADVMRQCRYFYYPAYNDASPNTLAEAIACGCEPLLVNESGGSVEVAKIFTRGKYSIRDMVDEYLKVFYKITKGNKNDK